MEIPFVEDHDAGARESFAIDETVRGRIAHVVHAQRVGLALFRTDDGVAIAQRCDDVIGRFRHQLQRPGSGEERKLLLHVVGDARRRGRQG